MPGTVRLADPLIEHLPLPAFLLDDEQRVAAVNPEFERLCGRPASEMVGRNVAVLHPREELPRLVEVLGRLRRAGADALRQSWRLVVAGGPDVTAEIAMRAVARDGGRCTLAVVAQVHADPGNASVAAPGERLRQIIEAFFGMAPAGCVVVDERGRVVQINRAYAEMSGWSATDLHGRDAMQVPSGDAALERDLMQRHLRTAPDSVLRSTATLVTKDGRSIPVERSSAWISDASGARLWVSVVTDLGARQALEGECRQLARQQGALLQTIAAGVMLVVRGRVVRCNRSLEQLLGLSAESILGQRVEHVLRADRSWEAICEAGAPASKADGVYTCELEVQRPGQEPVNCSLQLRPIDPADRLAGQIVSLHDLSELRRQQSSLRKANAELSALVENTAVAIAYLDGQRVVRANRLMESLLAAEPGKLQGRTLGQLFPPGDRAAAVLVQALDDPDRRACAVTTRLRRAGAEPVACVVHVGPVDPVRWPSASILVAIDVSAHEAALNALADSQERFGRFAEAVEEAVFVIDADRRSALYANSRLENVLCVRADEFFRDPDEAWRHVDARDRPMLDELLGRALRAGRHETDLRIVGPDAVERVVRVRLSLARLGSKELYVMAEDVTESRNSAQRRVDEAIQQRDTLVREVHHRIKNNLQGVAGLLQQAASRRPEIAGQLEEVVGQIQAIAQVHGIQVRGKGDLSIAKLVKAVLDNLSRGFGHPIEYAVDQLDALEEWTIPEQEAVPMALVVNELGTNAIKHCQGGGPIRAELGFEEESILLRLANPGALPPEFSLFRLDPAPSGLSLVKALLPRRGTRLSLTEDQGRVTAELQVGVPVLRRIASGNIA